MPPPPPAGPPLQSSTVLLQPQLPSSMSSSQQDAGDNRSIPGMDRVDELAEYLVELREQTGLTLNNQQVGTILDYKKIRQLVLCNGTLMQQTTLQRVGVNQTTLMQWNNQRLKGQEASSFASTNASPQFTSCTPTTCQQIQLDRQNLGYGKLILQLPPVDHQPPSSEVSIRLSVTAIVNWPAPARDRFPAMAPVTGARARGLWSGSMSHSGGGR
ncbi:hypothetical protein D4764_0122540 [Takifugu flavidus]|uniref:Uncharacterized protein n=1 Tax=Takifugu flavidus TaxID=433684 RepID=A0A5C6MDT8_9TELE|nr:hypothetical protein D4764_0122540 [Takifugu flavidus]